MVNSTNQSIDDGYGDYDHDNDVSAQTLQTRRWFSVKHMMMNSTQQYNVDDAYDNDNDVYDHDDDDCKKTVFETNKQSPQNEQLAFGLPNNPPAHH